MDPPRYHSSTSDASLLGQPLEFEFSRRTAKNRFMKAAMSEKLSSWDAVDIKRRGIPSEKLAKVYKHWGEGSFGQIVTGNIMIEYDHLEGRGVMIIPPDAEFSGPRFEAFKDIALAAKVHGSLILGQLNHPGRQVDKRIQPNPISASDVQLNGIRLGMEFAKPRAATKEDIARVINGFAHAAEYLDKAGFDGIQFHGAHGYLIAQFLSNTTNKRTDEYGGSLENRMRFIIEIVTECQKRVKPSFIFGIKINSVEFQEGGFSPEEARALCQTLESARFDYVELSGGTYESFAFEHKRESTKKREAFFLEFADGIVKPLTKTRSYITGGFKTVGAMVKALDTVDGVGLGRPVCQEFYLPREILEGKITAAIKMDIEDDNYDITAAAASAQIKQVAEDCDPINLSKKENVQKFFAALQAWAAENMNDEHWGKSEGIPL